MKEKTIKEILKNVYKELKKPLPHECIGSIYDRRYCQHCGKRIRQ